MTRTKPSSPYLTLEELCKVGGITSPEDYWQMVIEWDAAPAGGWTEEEQDAWVDEQCDKHRAAVVAAWEKTFGHHNLGISEVEKGKHRGEFKLYPVTNWDSALSQLRETINGVGFFYFGSNEQLRKSIPCTTREAVLTHWHHCADYGRVYGDDSPKRLYEKAMR